MTMAPRIEDLIAKVAAYLPEGSNLDLIDKSFQYSSKLHEGKTTPAGTPTLDHALAISCILAELHLDLRSIVAGLLHDVLQEELAEPQALKAVVGEEVAYLVEEVSKLSRAAFHGTEATRAEHMRQMILASTRDLRVILILLANRLQYMREIDKFPAQVQQSLARETQAIYAPIAHRLGVHFFKAEMEDQAFYVLEPESYKQLHQQVESRVAERTARIEKINTELKGLLEKNSVKGEVIGRTKHLFSIHNKMRKSRVELDRIHDLLATRVILDTPEECYRVLGLVHAAYTPIPGRFKDYIALPKENGYQSLQTLVFGASGDIFEIQIRTREMNQQAEMGIAAHFAYKDGTAVDERELASVSWFRQLLEQLEEGHDPRESMDLLTRELVPDQLFVFTPKGEVIKLPPGATPIDYAFAIHTEVGNHCMGARTDGRMVSIRTPLKNGSVVEIVTNSKQEPTEDWLKHAVSSKAQGRIRSYLRKKEKVDAILVGREHLVKEARRVGFKLEELLKEPAFEEWMRKHSYPNAEDLYAAEGFGRVNLTDVLNKLYPDGKTGKNGATPQDATRKTTTKAAEKATGKTTEKPAPIRRKQSKSLVSIDGMDNMMVRFAKCCTPVFGDPLAGIITRGSGVSVHHKACRNVNQKVYHEARFVEVQWAGEQRKRRPVNLSMTGRKSMKELLNLIGVLEEEEKTLITSGSISSKRGVYTQHFTIMVSDSKQLNRILQRLNAMEGIRAERDLESA